MRKLVKYQLIDGMTPVGIEDHLCVRLINGEHWHVGVGTGEELSVPELLQIYFCTEGSDPHCTLGERVSELISWLDRNGIDYSKSINLLSSPTDSIKGYLRNTGADRFGVHRAGSSPMPVRS
tara:strand:- start:1364 stop:1729 length:366 start_codon:yes stop_codon:yes gene_type:complete